MIEPSFVLAGAITGFVVGLTGVGGGALMTPILLVVFGVSPTTAIATDLWFATITKLVGARAHYARGQVDWQIARRLWFGSLPAALVSVAFVGGYGRSDQLAWLTQGVGVVVLLTAMGLLVAPSLLKHARRRRIGQPDRFKALQPRLTVVAGGFLGMCVALTSVGAGALGSVLLLYLYPLRMTPHRLIATDIVHAIPLAACAGIGYLLNGLVDMPMLYSLLLGSLPAVLLGAAVAGMASSRTLQTLLAMVLMGVGLKILV